MFSRKDRFYFSPECALKGGIVKIVVGVTIVDHAPVTLVLN
jgi:hypothetical protein